MTDNEKIQLRFQIVSGILQKGSTKSFDEAIKEAEKVYKWIMERTL